jgi:acetyl-CoA synthetase (ADP-forming)
MNKVDEIIAAAKKQGQKTLSEFESKQLLSEYGIPIVREVLVQDLASAQDAASEIGYPVVIKACSSEVTHKTEKGLIKVDLRTETELTEAFQTLQRLSEGLETEFLIQQMIKGPRELVIGMKRDQQFGPCVMFGLGGIFTEILHDVSFRVAPIDKGDALSMMRDIRGHKILEGIRGLDPVDLEILSRSLVGLGRLGLEHADIQEIDVNPLIVQGSKPIGVDALVVLGETQAL